MTAEPARMLGEREQEIALEPAISVLRFMVEQLHTEINMSIV